MFARLSSSLRRAGVAALVVIAAGAAVTLVPPTASAQAQTDAPAPAAAGWLARQLVDGERFEAVYGADVYPDHGLTIDAILAFASAGVSKTNAEKAITWLEDPAVADGYYGSYDDDPATATAGALAKLILAAQVTGRNPTAFAGRDLVSLLLTLQNPTTGRFADTGPYGDFANAFGQSFAVIALARTGAHPTETASAAGFLAGIQCDDGGFPESLNGIGVCHSQVDTTAMVVQALLAAGDVAVAGKGLDWLVSRQNSEGGFGDESDPDAPLNANKTGIAGQALRVGKRGAAADKAKAFLLTLQVGCSGDAANRGAIAADTTGFNAATANRATAQAILGLGGEGLATLTTDGAAADAPALLCASPTTPAATASTPATSPPPATATATPASTTDPATITSTRATGALPTTGASLGPVLLGGALLVIGGGFLVFVARRRRANSEA